MRTPRKQEVGKSRKTRRNSKPHWDSGSRELWFDGILVKQFRQAAANQDLLLSAFEEQKWRKWIDDPLPTVKGFDRRDRLINAVRRLNVQSTKMLVFHLNGKGTGVGWEPAFANRKSICKEHS